MVDEDFYKQFDEKYVLILNELEVFNNAYHECRDALNKIGDSLDDLYSLVSRMHNEILNNADNIHRDCEYYMENHDACSNYGFYTGLAFNVSRHKKCIKELLDE